MNAFDDTLRQYGADPGALRRFDEDSTELLPYATLLSARHSATDSLAALRAVYEWQGNPLVFLIDGESLSEESQLQALRRRIAMRGDAPYIGVVNPGQLLVYRVGLDAEPAERTRVSISISAKHISLTFAHLANARPGLPTKQRWIADVVLSLLKESITSLIDHANISDQDAISLVGRALFVRFLADRNLLPNDLFGIAPEQLFDSPKRVQTVCDWLDDTFNGDLLPISPGVVRLLPSRALATLGNILCRAPGGQLHLEWQEDWAHLDFSQIPVGVLSQSYEHYMRKHAQEKQRKEGSYYTPRHIADLMVRGAFHALRREGKAHTARVLDPSAGAGVFLLTAFRQLAAERWRHEGIRPDTAKLREILYEQITGFDINEAGLRFAALGLYLLSIELDPNPEPVTKLRFEDLRGRVLLKVGGNDGLGSLGDSVNSKHLGRYDLVIGNPPWSSSTGLANWPSVQQRVHKTATDRLVDRTPTSLLPNEVMDLPFVWRAMDWARPDGQIAFAMHARLLFQQSDGMPHARSALFRALDITGIVNGADLRNSRVWPEISAPFCLLYARNRLPPPGAGFRFVSPRLEDALSKSGSLRVDASNAEVIASDEVTKQPAILKIMFRGSRLDLEVFERMNTSGSLSLKEYWQPRHCGNGYQRLGQSSRVRKHGDGKPGVSADYLHGLEELTPLAFEQVLIRPPLPTKFAEARIHDRRPREIFLGPLFIVRESPSAVNCRIQVAVAENDLVFNKSYHGYSAAGCRDGSTLVRYLALLVGSKLVFWYALMRSGRLGVEREIVENVLIDELPILPIEKLDGEVREEINALFDAVTHEDTETAWARVDKWVGRLYGLRPDDMDVIDETLRFNLPFAANRRAAQARPTVDEQKQFCKCLESELQPWAERYGMSIRAIISKLPSSSPWGLLSIHTHSDARTPHADWHEVLRIADELASTEVLYPDPVEKTLWVARLAQSRYWGNSQARLLARRIVWEHGSHLFHDGNV